MNRSQIARLISLFLQLVGVAYISYFLPKLSNSIGYTNAIVVVVMFLVGVSKLGDAIFIKMTSRER